MTIAGWDSGRQCVLSAVGSGDIEDLVKQTLPWEWPLNAPDEGLRAGASIIRQDYYHYWEHPETGLSFCDEVTPYTFQMRITKLQGLRPGQTYPSTNLTTDDTVTKGWAPYGSGTADGVFLAFMSDLQNDSARLAHSQTWKAIVSSASYPPGEYAPGGHDPGGSIGVILPLGSACLYDCTADYDGDGLVNFYDNCPYVSNVGQQDYDGDSWGDAMRPR
jgi:hypothetical protein